MADIVSPECIRYTNEVVRPLAESFRALKARVDSALTTYHSGLGALFVAQQNDTIADGREAEGVSRLTGNDIILLASQLTAFQAQLNGAGVGNVISKPCVRPLQVQD